MRSRPVRSGERGRGDLMDWCRRQDGGPYPAYRDLQERFGLQGCWLELLRIQPDPFAGPTRVRLLVPWEATGLPSSLGRLPGGRHASRPGWIDPASARAVAWRDWLTRRVADWCRAGSQGRDPLRIDAPGQEVLDRSAVLFSPQEIELRLELDLPARGRRILGREALRRLVELPERLVAEVLSREGCDPAGGDRHADRVEDFVFLQAELERRGWIGFVADGARLARRAGNDDRPLLDEPAVPFESPPELRAEVSLPHGGSCPGMALDPGVTLLCGGGFHGKSTLLRALAAGLYPHIQGDGRERVAIRADAVSIRAEDGRAIHEVDLRPFLHDLPFGRSVSCFSTENASGSTSQAASILEAIEGGSRLLLIDEDTSATNFMIRDGMMDRLLARDREPIHPYLERARTLFEKLGVSSLLVIGGSGEYFRVADRVLALDCYRPRDRTEAARAIALDRPPAPADDAAAEIFHRACNPQRRRLPPGPPREARIQALDARRLRVGQVSLELAALESLRAPAQARFLARVLARRQWEQTRPRVGTPQSVETPASLQLWFDETWRVAGIDAFGPDLRGDLAAVRFADVLAACNRLRGRSEPLSGDDESAETQSREDRVG